MNRLVIDAGATKTAFTVLDHDQTVFEKLGKGINPNYCSEAHILQVLADFVQNCPNTHQITNVHYYGAGCASAHNALMMEELLLRFFPMAAVEVYSDLVAVCHALSMGETSVCSILGTGSASCLFDGRNVVNRAPSLGYMLGDEGSGTNLGKRLLTVYLRQQLPSSLAKALEEEFQLSPDKVIHRVYREPEPNKLMAQLSTFVHAHLDEPAMRELALSAFRGFFASQKIYYPQHLTWHISGSVAFFYQEVIQEAAALETCQLGRVVMAPMSYLIDYYKNI